MFSALGYVGLVLNVLLDDRETLISVPVSEYAPLCASGVDR